MSSKFNNQNSEDQSRANAEQQNEYVKELEASNEDYKVTINILEEKVDKQNEYVKELEASNEEYKETINILEEKVDKVEAAAAKSFKNS